MGASEDTKTASRGLRAFDVVRDLIKADLADGTLKVGDKLPAEREFAEKLGFGRAAIREALRGLEATGMIQLKKGVTGGAFIQGGDKNMVSRSIGDLIILGDVPLRQLMEVRSMLLMQAVRLACDHAENFDELELNINKTAEQSEDYELLYRNIIDFYAVVGKLSGNDVLAILINSLSSVTTSYIKTLHLEFTAELIPLRRAILNRLRARDSEGAARAVAENMSFLHGFIIARAASHKDE